MTIFNVRATEPLYIIIVREPQAESMLKNWVKEHRVEHTHITGNRLLIHHQHAFDRFCVTWAHNWDLVTVWDTWNRRHIYV